MAHPPVRFRAYIGPRPLASDDASAYGKWDWASAIGDAYAVPSYIGLRTLTATLSAGATAGMSISGSALPAAAGVWVGPNGAGQGWEYIAYHSSHTGVASIQREVQAGHNGVHTSGAPVHFWYPLDMNNGQLTITNELTDNMSAQTWTARLSGVRAPSHILKPEHIFMATWTLATNLDYDTVGAWNLLCLGFIEKVTMSNDSQNLAQWQIDIVSTARLLQQSTVPNMRIGPLDIALEAEADASSTLGAAWKITLPQRIQAAAGDIPEIDVVDLQADMGPNNIVDGNPNTLWVSDGWTGDVANFENSKPVNAWASIFMYPPPNALYGSRYVEIINHDGLDHTWIWIYSKYSYPSGTRARWYQVLEPDTFQEHAGVPTGSESFESVEDRLVFAENATIFRNLFPSAKPRYLLDGSQLSGFLDQENLRRLWWEGGAIFMAWSDPVNSRGYLIHWGDVTYAELENAWEPIGDGGLGQGTTDFTLPASNLYIPLTGAKPGMVLRREMQTADADWAFTWDYIHHPGYLINNDVNDSDFANWVKIVLPEMTHLLRDDIASGTTTIFVVDSQGAPNVEGISQHGSGGSIYIDDEIIPFTSKDYYAGTLTGCTVTQTHKAGSKVYVSWETEWWGEYNSMYGDPMGYPFKDKLFYLATSCYPIQKLKWGRGYYANGDDRHPYIGSMVWSFSLYEEARTPYEDSHERDYFSNVHIDSNGWLAAHGEDIEVSNAEVDIAGNSYFDDTGDGFRPKTLLMRIRAMHDDLGNQVTDRPRLNYVTVEVDRRYFNPDTWIDVPPAGYSNSLLVSELLQLSGQWPALFTVYSTAGDPTPIARSWGVTDRGTAWQVSVDMADYGGSIIDIRRNGRVRIKLNRYLYLDSHDIDLTLTQADVTSVEIVNIRPAEVGQVRLKWENGLTKASGVVVWPETLRRGGTALEIGPMLAVDADEALTVAFNLYQTKRYPYNVFYELADSDIDVEIGHIHQLDYPFHYTEEIIRKVLLVETVEHEFSEGRLKTIIGSREIARETV